MQPALQGFWVPCSPELSRRFHLSPGLFRLPSPATFATGSSSHERHVPFRVQRDPHPPPARSRQQLPWGLSPLRDISQRRPHPRGIPALASFRPRRFSRPRRFAPPPALRVYFAPQPRPGFALQGFVPPALPHGLVARRFPRAVGSSRLRPRLPVTAPANRPSTSGLCSALESPGSTQVLPCAGPRPLLGFASSGFSLRPP